MNKNVQGETNLHQPVSQTTTFYWVSTSQTHHRSFPTLTRQRRSATCTHMWSVCLSRSCQHQGLKQPTPFQGMSTVSPLPSQLPPALVATSQQPGTTFCPLGRRLSLPFGGGTNSQLVERGCGSLLGRLSESGKNTHHLLHRYSCQPPGKRLKCPGADGKKT